jgi:murein DD-endopeptidase MepM/ murein hydrolase activator NlpD
MEQRLATVEQAMGLIEVGQLRELDALLQTARHEASRLRGAVAQVGLDPEAVQAPAKTAATGGPLVPLPIDPKAGPFERLVDEVQASVAQADRLRRVALRLPLARPVPGEAETTSGFGYRLDPFTRSPALHTGLDFAPSTAARCAPPQGGG